MWHEGVRELKGGKSFYKYTLYLMESIHIFFKGMKFHRKPKEEKIYISFFYDDADADDDGDTQHQKNFIDDILNAANEI